MTFLKRNPNIWVEKLDEKVRQFLRVGGKIVIDDIRFPNEFSYVKEILPSR
ncbi:MAG: hypothetical protein LWW94_06845 [Candidatus Desulfofervidaceae bacterium]|nr:hypothetical protein [Candidatus Desulfofervidaceae bacterium]